MRRFAGVGLNHGGAEAQRSTKKKFGHELHEWPRIKHNKELTAHRWTSINTDVPRPDSYRVARRELRRMLLTDCTEKHREDESGNAKPAFYCG